MSLEIFLTISCLFSNFNQAKNNYYLKSDYFYNLIGLNRFEEVNMQIPTFWKRIHKRDSFLRNPNINILTVASESVNRKPTRFEICRQGFSPDLQTRKTSRLSIRKAKQETRERPLDPSLINGRRCRPLSSTLVLPSPQRGRKVRVKAQIGSLCVPPPQADRRSSHPQVSSPILGFRVSRFPSLIL